MAVIYILLAFSASIAFLFLLAFLWSLHTGQYDDDYSPPRRILFDDEFDVKPKIYNENEN